MKSCTCKQCVAACKTNPGWMTPGEAIAAIEAGHARKLMRDWYEPERDIAETVYVLAPAAAGHGGGDAPDMPSDLSERIRAFLSGWQRGRCVFLKKNNRCAIHSSGFKPKQCRDTLVCEDVGSDNYAMAKLWRGPEGRRAIRLWRQHLT